MFCVLVNRRLYNIRRLVRDGEFEVSRLSPAAISRSAAVDPGVRGGGRTNEVDRELGQRSVGDVEVPVEQHRGRRPFHGVAVLPQSDRSRSLDEDATAHARRTSCSRKHLHTGAVHT